MKPTILIAGAAGATGRAATELLLKKGFAVRALVRREDERSERLRSQGADIVIGDLLDYRSLRSAFDGVQRAYMVYPMRPGLIEATCNFAEAALGAKVDFIVNMSQRTAREDAISDSALKHWLAERILDRSGLSVTHLRPTAFAEWFLYMRNMIKEGRYSVPFEATGRFAPIAAADQGAVIAAILAEPKSHEGRTYPLYGPAEMTPSEIAALAGQVLGKVVRYEKISPEQWVREVTGQDIPFLSQHLTGIAYDHKQGMMAGTNDNVERITGKAPMSLASYLEKHRELFA